MVSHNICQLPAELASGASLGVSSGVRTTSSNDACKASSQRIAKRLRPSIRALANFGKASSSC